MFPDENILGVRRRRSPVAPPTRQEAREMEEPAPDAELVGQLPAPAAPVPAPSPSGVRPRRVSEPQAEGGAVGEVEFDPTQSATRPRVVDTLEHTKRQYDYERTHPAKDTNGWLKSMLINAVVQMGRNANAALASGRPIDEYGFARVLGGGIGGAAAGAISPYLDEEYRQQGRMRRMQEHIKFGIHVNKAAADLAESKSQTAYRDEQTNYLKTGKVQERQERKLASEQLMVLAQLRGMKGAKIMPETHAALLNRYEAAFGDRFDLEAWNNQKSNFVIRGLIDPDFPNQRRSTLAKRYLRAQLSPSAAVAVDYKTGETFDGEEFTRSQAAADLVVPFIIADAYEGWKAYGGSAVSDLVPWPRKGQRFTTRRDASGRETTTVTDETEWSVPSGAATGFKGAAMGLPGFLGAGVNFYDSPEEKAAARGSATAPARMTPEQIAASMPAPVRDELKRLRFTVPPLPKNLSTEGPTGESVRARSKEQLASFTDEEYSELQRRDAEEVSAALESVITNPDFQSFESDAQRRTFLGNVIKEARGRVLNGSRLNLRQRQVEGLDQLQRYQKRLEDRTPQPKPGERVRL